MSKGYTAKIIRPSLSDEERQMREDKAKEAVARFAIATKFHLKKGCENNVNYCLEVHNAQNL